MSAQTIDRALITQFSTMVHVRAQQIRSRLRPFVQIKPMVGDFFAYDGLGTVEAVEANQRIAPVTFQDIEHNRRKIKRRRFHVTLPIDASDVRGMLLDPAGEYASASVMAMERKFDAVGIDSTLADVETGREFETTTTAATDGVNVVDATGGLIYEKLLEIKRVFMNNEVGNDTPEEILLLITGDEHEQLMQETELTSGDFSRQFVVDQGMITRALGMRLIVYGASVPNPLLNVVTTTRDNIALASRGLCYGLSKDMSISVKPRTDLLETDQVQIITQLGAVRTEGKLVQEVNTTTI